MNQDTIDHFTLIDGVPVDDDDTFRLSPSDDWWAMECQPPDEDLPSTVAPHSGPTEHLTAHFLWGDEPIDFHRLAGRFRWRLL